MIQANRTISERLITCVHDLLMLNRRPTKEDSKWLDLQSLLTNPPRNHVRAMRGQRSNGLR